MLRARRGSGKKRECRAQKFQSGIVKLRVVVAVFSQLVHPLRRPRTQIIEPSKHDRFRWTNFRARRCEAALLSVVAERAFECASRVRQWLGPSIDYAKRTRHNAVPAAVANIVLHEHRTDFGANDCARGTCFKTTSFLAVLADIRKKNPAKRILVRRTLLSAL